MLIGFFFLFFFLIIYSLANESPANNNKLNISGGAILLTPGVRTCFAVQSHFRPNCRTQWRGDAQRDVCGNNSSSSWVNILSPCLHKSKRQRLRTDPYPGSEPSLHTSIMTIKKIFFFTGIFWQTWYPSTKWDKSLVCYRRCRRCQ